MKTKVSEPEKEKKAMNNTGIEMHQLMTELYPICRSITGNGTRRSLEIIKRHVPIEIREVPSGTKVFDWVIPGEWNINDAYIKNSKGEKIVDFKKSNLHVLNYSGPVNKKMPLGELKGHLFTLPEYPEWVPYLTSYYKENWGFCITHNLYEQLKEDVYEAVIDSTLESGSLTYGEFCVKGEIEEEVLLSTYICHPSMCNDNLSGIVLLTSLARRLIGRKPRYSYRFLFIPETIGAIAWLSLNESRLARIRHGLVATCVGGPGRMTYKKSRRGDAEIDKAAEKSLADSGSPYDIIDFFPTGSDERQFCSPGFNLPVGSLIKTFYNSFPEYHTSADNLEFVTPEQLAYSFERYLGVIDIIEDNAVYLTLNPKCEPCLGKRGLYEMIGARKGIEVSRQAILWVLNLSDGANSLLDISIRSGLRFDQVKTVADILVEKNLLKKVG